MTPKIDRLAVTLPEIEAAVDQLSSSGRGREAMRALVAMLDDGAVTLDIYNQNAVFTLLAGTWGLYTGTARDLMREAVPV